MKGCGNKIGPYDCCTIVTGDAKELAPAIPDESVDLIFTDPVYDRIEDYRWLAGTAARVLKDDKACLSWCSNIKQYEAREAMGDDLFFVMPLLYTVVAKARRLIGYNAFVWTTPCLWFAKGKGYPYQRTIDTVISYASPVGDYKWQKNPEAIERWIHDFTWVGELVADFFCGGGTVPAVCKMLGRHYLAFEIDPEVAERARERVQNTQPPLFVMEPEQMGFAT